MKTFLLLSISILSAFSVQGQNNQAHTHPEHLDLLVNEYLNMKNALVSDNLESAQYHLMAFSNEVTLSSEMNQHEKHSEQHAIHHSTMVEAVHKAQNADDLASFRIAFKEISEQFLIALENQGYEGTLFKQFCPMYEGGSAWISDKEEIENPYYGSMMHNCGEKVSEI